MSGSPSEEPAPHPLDYAPVASPITLRTFYSAIDAQIQANALAEAGISYGLLNGNTNTLGPYAAFSQVELQVDERDREDAERVLQQLESSAVAEDAEGELDESDGASDEPRCPRCRSWQTYTLPTPWPGLLNFLLGRASEQARQLECLKCHHRWAQPILRHQSGSSAR